MKKSDIKPLIKFILREILTPKSTTLVDNWKEISTVKHGRMAGSRGYFIMKNSKLLDASVEMEWSTGLGGGVDHFGVAASLNNRKLFGIPDELADKILSYGDGSEVAMSDESHLYYKLWDHIKNSIIGRVLTIVETSNTHKPDITIQFFKNISPKSALKLAQELMIKGKLPDVPENSQVTIDINDDVYLQANSIKEFLSTSDPRQLKY